MAFFLVTMSHPHGGGWDDHLAAHVEYLNLLVHEGKLRASGPLKNTSLRSGFLIFAAADEAEVRDLVSKDPFAIQDLIESLTVQEWDPLFGEFAADSTGLLAGRPISSFA